MDPKTNPNVRRDGWTAERQLRFLDGLAATGSITKAAASAGMSREGAYRLARRKDGALFARPHGEAPLLWPTDADAPEGHKHLRLGVAVDAMAWRIFRGNASKVTKPTKPTAPPRALSSRPES